MSSPSYSELQFIITNIVTDSLTNKVPSALIRIHGLEFDYIFTGLRYVLADLEEQTDLFQEF